MARLIETHSLAAADRHEVPTSKPAIAPPPPPPPRRAWRRAPQVGFRSRSIPTDSSPQPKSARWPAAFSVSASGGVRRLGTSGSRASDILWASARWRSRAEPGRVAPQGLGHASRSSSSGLTTAFAGPRRRSDQGRLALAADTRVVDDSPVRGANTSSARAGGQPFVQATHASPAPPRTARRARAWPQVSRCMPNQRSAYAVRNRPAPEKALGVALRWPRRAVVASLRADGALPAPRSPPGLGVVLAERLASRRRASASRPRTGTPRHPRSRAARTPSDPLQRRRQRIEVTRRASSPGAAAPRITRARVLAGGSGPLPVQTLVIRLTGLSPATAAGRRGPRRAPRRS